MVRKRKGGIKLENEDDTPAEETTGDTANSELAQKLQEETEQKKAEKEKKRAENLWASFLSDVKPHAKPPPKTPQTSTACKEASLCVCFVFCCCFFQSKKIIVILIIIQDIYKATTL